MAKTTTIVLTNGEYEKLQYSDNILASGELAVAVDSGVIKIGNSSSRWGDLNYAGVPSNPTPISGASGINNIVQISQADYDGLASYDNKTLYFII